MDFANVIVTKCYQIYNDNFDILIKMARVGLQAKNDTLG